jgi:choline-sulfatase
VLAGAGHDVASFGKLHHRGAADDAGFTERHLPMYIHGGVGWLQGLSRRDPIEYDEAVELAADVGIGETTYTRYDRRVTDQAATWLRSAERDDRPWAAFVSFVAPHYPLSAPDEFAAMYPSTDVAPPEIGAVDHAHPAVDAMQRFFNYGDYFDDRRTAEARAAYFALCSFMDHNVGEVLAALDASGQRDNTRIIYTSDHGEMLGNRGLWCKSFMFEDSVGVPMIVSGPGVPSGAVVDSNVNLVDLASTAIETIDASYDGPGESLWHRANHPGSDRVGFSEYHDGGSITGSFALQADEWKFVHHEDYAPELFNVVEDPDELTDLAGSAKVAHEQSNCARLLSDLVDTTAVNDAAFASQEALIVEHGGRDALASAFRFNHTPTPD